MRKGPYIVVYPGIPFWPCDPHPNDILIETIAHALANANRFSGHTTMAYSVAEHSLNMSRACSGPTLPMRALLHDASEAYLGDVASPIKHLDCMEEFRLIDMRLQELIFVKFGVDPFNYEDDKAIHDLDKEFVLTEARDLLPGAGIWDWKEVKNGYRPRDAMIKQLGCPHVAEMLFLSQYDTLRGHGNGLSRLL